MSYSIVPFVISLIVASRLRSFTRANNLPELEKQYKYAVYLSIVLFAVGFIFSESFAVELIWHIYLLVLVGLPFVKTELFQLRMSLLAFVPFVVAVLLKDLTQLVSSEFYSANESYFDNGIALSVIWMLAIMFSQNRQRKAQEKDRIKRQHEDELNRAIAIRKVELEGLVAERTAELTKQKEELELTLQELRATQTQLIQSEKMASLGELTAGIAHEIQNPLNFVNNFSEVSGELIDEMNEELDKGDINEAKAIAGDIRQNLEKINHHGKRADAIVKGMLQHSRSKTGQKELTDINKLADEYLRLAYHGLRAKDKTFNSDFKLETDETLPEVNVIPQDIGRVLLNLINNAFYAVDLKSKENSEAYKPKVEVKIKRLKNEVEIRVKDNGSGIPATIKEKIFQPFFTTKPTGQGTGLGLSLSYDIIKAHGGEISVNSNENEDLTGEQKGTEFIIRLPIS